MVKPSLSPLFVKLGWLSSISFALPSVLSSTISTELHGLDYYLALPKLLQVYFIDQFVLFFPSSLIEMIASLMQKAVTCNILWNLFYVIENIILNLIIFPDF